MQVTQNRLVDCMYLCTDLNISMLVSKDRVKFPFKSTSNVISQNCDTFRNSSSRCSL